MPAWKDHARQECEPMPVVTMPRKTRPRKTKLRKLANPQTILSTTLGASLGATLHELCRYLAASPTVPSSEAPLSEKECAALAAAALGGFPEAEFLVGSVFDAANDPARAMEWYRLSASRDYAPAMLQLFALR
jgi:TPR repeat protein